MLTATKESRLAAHFNLRSFRLIFISFSFGLLQVLDLIPHFTFLILITIFEPLYGTSHRDPQLVITICLFCPVSKYLLVLFILILKATNTDGIDPPHPATSGINVLKINICNNCRNVLVAAPRDLLGRRNILENCKQLNWFTNSGFRTPQHNQYNMFSSILP